MLNCKFASLLFFVFAVVSLSNFSSTLSQLSTQKPVSPKKTKKKRGPIFSNDKFVQEIKTSSQLDSLLKYLVTSDHLPSKPEDLENLKVSKDDMVYLIMYYADWCPHCHKTAPIWRNLAYFLHCTQGVRVFAFECSMSQEDRIGADRVAPYEACGNQGIEAYPAMVAYLPKRLESGRLPNYQHFDHNQLWNTSEFPSVKWGSPATTNTTTNMVTELSYSVTDSNGAKRNNEILLRVKIEVVDRTFSAYRDWVVQYTPIVEKKCILLSDSDILDIGSLSANFLELEELKKSERWPTQLFEPCPDTRLHDALIGLLYLLRNWVVKEPKVGLSRQENNDLKQLMFALVTLLPGHNIQRSLLNFNSALHRHPTLSFTEYHGLIDRLDLGGLKAVPIGEKPTLLQTTRLTSTMWLLLHTLTVSLYSQTHLLETGGRLSRSSDACRGGSVFPDSIHFGHSQSLTTSFSESYTVTPWCLAKTMRTLVASFFACSVCRIHFLTFFDLCYADLCKWVKEAEIPYTQPDNITRESRTIHDSAEGLLLWLWRFHNAVTFRTATERTSDSIVTLQEMMKSQDKQNLPKNEHLVNYVGKDVRFPPPTLCPSCRQLLPVKVTDGNETFFELPGGRNISAEAFTVSNTMVETSVKMERMRRGYDISNSSALAHINYIDDSAWDQVIDFDFDQVKNILLHHFWRPEWMNYFMDLQWNSKDRRFTVLESISHAADDGATITTDGMNDKAIITAGEFDAFESKTPLAPATLPTPINFPQFPEHDELISKERNLVPSIIQERRSNGPSHGAVGIAGGLFWLLGLSTVLIFVGYTKAKSGNNGVNNEFFRTIGLRRHYKAYESPLNDMEIGRDRENSSGSSGSFTAILDRFYSRQRH